MARAPLVFIASPLSCPDAGMKAARVDEAAKFAAWVMAEEGKNVYPAAVTDHHIGRFMEKAKGLEWWTENMETFMAPAESCYVLCLDGWEVSKGVALEVDVAVKLGKPVYRYVATSEGYVRQ